MDQASANCIRAAAATSPPQSVVHRRLAVVSAPLEGGEGKGYREWGEAAAAWIQFADAQPQYRSPLVRGLKLATAMEQGTWEKWQWHENRFQLSD